MTYNYSEFNAFNRFINIDGVESKIIEHLLSSDTKYAQMFWKILKYDTKDVLAKEALSREEKIKLIDGYNDDDYGGQTENTRLFFSPFCNDAWNKEATSVYIYVDDIYPVNNAKSTVSVTVETITHIKINSIYGDADEIANPEGTNPNDYYLDNPTPVVQYKSRATTLLKCVLAELNGLYIDGVGYLSFITDKGIEGNETKGKARMSIYNSKSFFGHSIQFNLIISGVSDTAEYGY